MIATLGEIQRNLSRVLKSTNAIEKITITKKGAPVAILPPIARKNTLKWPDFYRNCVRCKYNGFSI